MEICVALCEREKLIPLALARLHRREGGISASTKMENETHVCKTREHTSIWPGSMWPKPYAGLVIRPVIPLLTCFSKIHAVMQQYLFLHNSPSTFMSYFFQMHFTNGTAGRENRQIQNLCKEKGQPKKKLFSFAFLPQKRKCLSVKLVFCSQIQSVKTLN